MNSFETIRKNNQLLYEYIRGSHLYGLNHEHSDIDSSGVYFCPQEDLLGLGFNYKPQISDEKHDCIWFEIGNYMHLLLKSNPTILESLFVPKDKIIGEVSPSFIPILENRDKFITKQCFKPMTAYAYEQIKKARGLNKKIVNPVTQRLSPLDFIYTFYGQGSTKIKNFLEYRGLKQKYCGLVNISNMHDVYGVYYDWGTFFKNEKIELRDLIEYSNSTNEIQNHLFEFIQKNVLELSDDNKCFLDIITEWYNSQQPLGYNGIVRESRFSADPCLSTVKKGAKPICYISYNQTGYTKHCLDYKNYKEWEANRNPIRYESNLAHNYDSKNMMHCIRLIHMAIEIANGEGVKLLRTWDKEFLLRIKNHQIEYEDLLSYAENQKQILDKAVQNSTIPDSVDYNLVNDLLLEIRNTTKNKN